jgi:hypothetical protein
MKKNLQAKSIERQGIRENEKRRMRASTRSNGRLRTQAERSTDEANMDEDSEESEGYEELNEKVCGLMLVPLS